MTIISVQIRRVSRYVYDVFAGEGWDTWSRVQRLPRGMRQLAGIPMPDSVMTGVYNFVSDHPEGSIKSVEIVYD